MNKSSYEFMNDFKKNASIILDFIRILEQFMYIIHDCFVTMRDIFYSLLV